MLKKIRNIKVVQKVLIFVVAVLVLTCGLITAQVYVALSGSLKQDALDAQGKNIAVAASLLKRDVAGADIAYAKDGNGVARIAFSSIPTFTDNDLIDEVGKITGETATIFLWDEESRDFWRKTTNIIKPDGKPAVGTPLGKNGAVYPYMVDGERYIGEANILGKDYLTRYDPIFLGNSKKVIGILYVGLEEAKFIEKRNSILEGILIVSAIIGVVALAALLLFLRHLLSKNINRVVGEMNRLSGGEKDIEIGGTSRGDEFGDMGRALEVFRNNALEVERLQKDQAEAEKRQAEERRKAMLDMADEFEGRVGGVVEGVEKAASDLQAMAVSLAAAVEESTKQSAAVASTSQQAAGNVGTVAAASEELSASIREISKNVSDTAQTAKSCADAAQTSQGKLEHLQSAVQEINTVIQGINDIAEQTNLLALNATIEAARAGEAGKGFAVVANEVKSLASQTHIMTDEVTQKINEIRESSEETVVSVSEIIKRIADVDTQMGSVAAAVEEQNASTEDISRNVQEASRGVSEVSENIVGVQQAANETAESTTQIETASNRLAEQAVELKQAVSGFLQRVRAG